MKKILLVEDDPAIAQVISSDLAGSYALTVVRRVFEARVSFSKEAFDLLLLDVSLPDGQTYDFCREARDADPNLIIFYLSARVDEESAVRGLSSGANDYLRKPFGRRELLVKIRQHLERRRGELKYGPLRLKLDGMQLLVHEKTVTLTPNEFTLLRALMEHREEAVPKETLIRAIDSELDISDGTLGSHLSRLRSKLKGAGASEIRIASVYGMGYRLEHFKDSTNAKA